MKNAVNNLMTVIYSEMERFYKPWYILSWAMLLLGYSLLIVAYTLFGNAPIWITFFGLIGIAITLFNFFIALLVAGIYLHKGIKERDEELKRRAYLVLAYNFAAGLMYFAVVL